MTTFSQGYRYIFGNKAISIARECSLIVDFLPISNTYCNFSRHSENAVNAVFNQLRKIKYLWRYPSFIKNKSNFDYEYWTICKVAIVTIVTKHFLDIFKFNESHEIVTINLIKKKNFNYVYLMTILSSNYFYKLDFLKD